MDNNNIPYMDIAKQQDYTVYSLYTHNNTDPILIDSITFDNAPNNLKDAIKYFVESDKVDVNIKSNLVYNKYLVRRH